MVGYFHHIFLKHHHPKGFAQYLFHHGVQVLCFFGLQVADDVFAHHATAGHAGPYNGTGYYQRFVGIAAQLAEQLPHGRAFDIKAADGVDGAQPLFYQRIFLELLYLVDLYAHALVFVYQLYGFFDMAQATLTEDIEFVEPGIFCYMHIDLRGRKPLGGKKVAL